MATDWELGEPVKYSTERGASVPLSKSTIWPASMLSVTAELFADLLEERLSDLLGAADCGFGHESWWLIDGRCSWCKAAV